MKIFLTTITALAVTSANFLLLQPSLAQATLRFPPARDQGQPRTIGAGTRLLEDPIGTTRGGAILSPDESLVAIAPKNIANQGIITSLQNPELFFYLPVHTAETGRFILVNEAQDPIYQATYDLRKTDGLIRIRLPKSVVLAPEENYQWEFGLDCANWREENTFIQGSINIKNAYSLTDQSLAPLEQARIYAENNIWNETLIIAAENRNEYPQAWRDLLDSVGLGEFAEQSLIEPFIQMDEIIEADPPRSQPRRGY